MSLLYQAKFLIIFILIIWTSSVVIKLHIQAKMPKSNLIMNFANIGPVPYFIINMKQDI